MFNSHKKCQILFFAFPPPFLHPSIVIVLAIVIFIWGIDSVTMLIFYDYFLTLVPLYNFYFLLTFT